MAKSIEKTQRILDLLSQATGGAVDPATVSIFEARALSTKSIRKKGSIFDKAKHTRNFLSQMADYLNNGESVPLHTLHLQGAELPTGKLIKGSAQVFDMGDGVDSELRVLFYVLNTEAKLIEKLENDIIDEVSVGIAPKSALCSECGFDFLGADATSANWWDRVCANDHTIGENGVHLNIPQLDRWYEMSLVSKGAATEAKILPKASQLLAAETITRLAASGIPADATLLSANTPIIKPTESNMTTEVTALTASLTAAVTEGATAKAELKIAQAQLAAAQTDLAAANTQIATLTASAGTDKSALQTQLTAASGDVTKALEFLSGVVTRAATAAGKPRENAPATIDEALTAIDELGLKLGELVPIGGRSQAAANDDDKAPRGTVASLANYQTR